MRRTPRTLVVATVLAALLGGAAACDSGSPAAEKSTASSSPSVAAPPPPAPAAHACYDLDLAEAGKPSSTTPPVACSATHTAVTIQVGTVNPVVDGHLLSVDSDSVQQQIAARCRTRFARVVGGNEETRRITRLAVVWFSPSLEQSDQGARWFRCDVVALAGRGTLAPLPRSVRGILGAPDALDRFGTCGTSSPSAKRFARVICSRRHSWRVRATIDLPRTAKYLGKAAGAAADSACRDIDARAASDILRLAWSFEWPTRAQWTAGQRYGYCWTPDPA